MANRPVSEEYVIARVCYAGFRSVIRALLHVAGREELLHLFPASDHGPVFGLAAPTNPKGGWSFDLGVNGCGGTASTVEAALSYGLTQNLKLAVSGPVVFHPYPYPRSSITTKNSPMSGNFSALSWWCFQRKDFNGKRVESTAIAGAPTKTLVLYLTGAFTAYLPGPILVYFDS